jgi:hypothetical protein
LCRITPIIIQIERKRDTQKIVLRTTIISDELLAVFAGLNRKIVNFSFRLLPAANRTSEEKRSSRNGNKKSIKIILSFIIGAQAAVNSSISCLSDMVLLYILSEAPPRSEEFAT